MFAFLTRSKRTETAPVLPPVYFDLSGDDNDFDLPANWTGEDMGTGPDATDVTEGMTPDEWESARPWAPYGWQPGMD